MSEKKFTITDTGDGNTAHRNDCGCGRCNQPLVGRVEPVRDLAAEGLSLSNDSLVLAFETARSEIARLEAENARLREALNRFLDKWAKVERPIGDAFVIASIHGMKYDGPTIEDEIGDLRRAAEAVKEGE